VVLTTPCTAFIELTTERINSPIQEQNDKSEDESIVTMNFEAFCAGILDLFKAEVAALSTGAAT
jgi:hypothetical protein